MRSSLHGKRPYMDEVAMPDAGLAVIWDVDGTLVDTAELHYQAWCALAKEIGKPFSRADFAGTFGWRNLEILSSYTAPTSRSRLREVID